MFSSAELIRIKLYITCDHNVTLILRQLRALVYLAISCTVSSHLLSPTCSRYKIYLALASLRTLHPLQGLCEHLHKVKHRTDVIDARLDDHFAVPSAGCQPSISSLKTLRNMALGDFYP